VKAQGVVTVDGVMVAEATVMCIVSDKPAKKTEPVPVK
jgi:hypothetical protein